MMYPREGECLVTVQEFARAYRVHAQTVYSAIRRGLFKFPVVKLTNRSIRILVPRASIQMHTDAH